jgi:para-nitrobenzyl esterase
MSSMFQQRNIYSGPMVDGKLMPESAEQAYKEGKQAAVPLMVGANSADIGFNPAHNLDELFAPFGAQAAAARAAFHAGPNASFKQVAQQVGQIEDMIEPARFIARRMAAAGQPVYEYRFSYVAAAMRKKLQGAPHSSEIPYVFGTIRQSMWSNFGKGIAASDLRAARQVNAYWVNFAKTGDPNGAGLPRWPKISAHGDQLMNFTLRGPKAETDPWKAQLDLVETIQP